MVPKELNLRPTDYESVALPVLFRLLSPENLAQLLFLSKYLFRKHSIKAFEFSV